MADPHPIRPISARSASLAVFVATLWVPACTPIGNPVPPTGAQSPVSVQAPDPTRSVYFSWDPIDKAVEQAAIEYLVVATPEEAIDAWMGAKTRRYRLLAPRDQPGSLTVTRGEDDGRFMPGTRTITLTARIGRFGNPDLESAVLGAIAERLGTLVDQASD